MMKKEREQELKALFFAQGWEDAEKTVNHIIEEEFGYHPDIIDREDKDFLTVLRWTGERVDRYDELLELCGIEDENGHLADAYIEGEDAFIEAFNELNKEKIFELFVSPYGYSYVLDSRQLLDGIELKLPEYNPSLNPYLKED